MKLRLQLFWAGVQDVACEVGLAPLPHYFLKLSLNRLNQTTVLVGDHKVYSPKPSSFEPRQEVIPTAVSLAVANPKPQHLAVSPHVHPYGDECALWPYPSAFPY